MYFYDQNNPNFTENSDNLHSKNAPNAIYSNASFDPNDHIVEPQESPIDFLNNNQLEFDSNNLFNESSLFDPSSANWDHPPQHQQALDMQQEAILLSDPNFVRQHQLLRDQHAYQEQPAEKEQTASNLTAMFEPTKQQQAKKKQSNRRQHVVGKSNVDDNVDDQNEAKIDHQRRFNELQARFRVNYAPKASQSSKGKSAKKYSTSPQPQNTTSKRASSSAKSTVTHQSPSPVPPFKDDDTIKLEYKTEDQQKPSQTSSTPTPLSKQPPPPTSPAPTNVAMIGGLVMNTNNNNREDSFSSKEVLSSSVPTRTMPIQIQRVTRPNSNQPFDAESHQRELDNQLTKVDFDDITVSELKEMLRQRGKPATGKKAILLQRLQEERDIAKGGRSPGSSRLTNRHSQPLPFSSRSLNLPETPKQQRPRSFQGGGSGGTMPVTINNANNSAYHHAAASSASPSMPSFLPPGSPGGQLHRSIANMHIGSPPATTSRRYSPYSPRLSSSPKTTHHEYSSSVPVQSGDLSSSPNNSNSNNNNTSAQNNVAYNHNNGNGMMLSSSYSATRPANRYYNNPKTYKPFTSSALATPDREEDVNPFDRYYAGGESPITEEKTIPEPEINYNTHNLDSNNSVTQNFDSMDWTDPSALELLLQQGTYNMNVAEMIGQPLYSDDVVLTNDQIMALLNTQQTAPPFEFRLNDTHFTPDQPLYEQQQQQQQQQIHHQQQQHYR
ncbi:hypothetical protein PS15m_005974 [Mucor circinelloides]